jgi:YVTN family beta-propeller protein
MLAIRLAIIATDPDGDALTYSATGLPPGLTIATNTGLISGAVTTPGSYNVIVKVQDDKGASSALNFNWAVSQPLLVINPISTTPQAVNTTVNLTASVSNGTNPKFKWSFGDGTPETDYSSTAAISHTYTAPRLAVVRVTVLDQSGITNTATFIQAIYLPHTTNQPTLSANMAVSTNRLWVVNQDNDTVSVFNTDTNGKLAEIAVGKSPRSIAIAPDGRVWISNKAEATLSIINPATLQVQQTVSLPFASQPFGLAFAPDGNAAYVVLEATGKLMKLDATTGATIASVDIGTNPRYVSIIGDSGKILVSRYITAALPGESTAAVQTAGRGGEVVVVNAGTMAIDKTVVLQYSDIQDTNNTGSGIPNYLAMPVISPDGKSAWIPSKKDNIKRGVLRNGNNLNFQNAVRSISSKIDLVALSEDYGERIDFDNSGLASAAVFDHSGNYMFVALETSREVAIVDAYGGTELRRIQVGRAPDGLAVSADGQKLFVNNFMDRTVSVVDLTDVLSRGDWTPPVTATLAAVGTEKLPPTVLTGKQLFYDARDPRLASDGYLSCAVCHNDGGQDGRVWDLTGFGEGLRNTIDLRGRAGVAHGLLHWTGNFDEIQDFEGQIRNLAGGSGLMGDADFAATQDTLGVAKAGKSADLDALAAYVTSLNTFAPSPQRNPDGSLTAPALAGKTLFQNAGCVQCHGGNPFTDSPSRLLHDVGTITQPGSGKRLNGPLTGFDTPTMRDVWNTAPYLHDGSATTLNDAISAHTSVTLSTAEIAQVAAYIQQVGGTEAVTDNIPPTVTVTSPANGITVSGSAVTVSANASDNVGVTGVQFKLDGVNLAVEDTIAPYSINWNSTTIANGSHTLTAVARDADGNATTSAVVTVTVSNTGPLLPDVVVTSLTYAGGVFKATVKNQGTAATPAGVFIGVGYRVNGVFKTWGGINGPLAPGASVTIGTNGGLYVIPNGTPTIEAYVDDANRFAESDETNNKLAQTITVGGSDSAPPTVAITNPAIGNTVSGSAVAVSANASDNVGVTGVQFKLDGINLGAEDTIAPYGVNWNSATAINGTHTLVAVARDAAGNTTASTVVAVTVSNTGPLLPDVVVTSLTYAGGVFKATVKNQGTAATPAGVFIGVAYFVNDIKKTWGGVNGPLAPGASATIGTSGGSYVIPSGTPTIAAYVDDVNRFAESDETNNKLSLSITLP